MKQIFSLIMLCALSSQASAEWHHLQKITKVSVLGNTIVVQGTNPSGHSCGNYNGFYGTLYHTEGSPGHKEYYAMALTAYTAGKGMSCYVTFTGLGDDAVCKMENCHMIN